MRLIELAEAGDTAGVLESLRAMTPEQRTGCAEEVDARYREMVETGWMELTYDQKAAILSARLGCRATPKGAFATLRSTTMTTPGPSTWMVDIVNLHPAAWQAELVEQIGEQAVPVRADEFTIADHIVRTTGCPPPTSDAYINAWLNSRMTFPTTPRPAHTMDGARGADPVERLRSDVCSPALLPLVVARPGVRITNVAALGALAAEGMIDRAALVRRVFAGLSERSSRGRRDLEQLALTPDEHARMSGERVALAESVLARLLQDGTRMETAPHREFLWALGLTPDENAPFLRDFVAMLDLSMPVASQAHEVLIGLDEAGLLEPDVLSEVGERVLLRPEKKLVRAQLSWLDRVAKKDPSRSGRVAVDASLVFQHPDTALQERALKVVARHLKAAGDDVPPELREAAGGLSPGLEAQAAALFGVQAETAPEPYAEVLPEVPVPRTVPGPIATVAEVAQEVAAVIANPRDVVTFERALDGLVRHARMDREALSAALKPVMRREPRHFRAGLPADLYDVAAAVRGDEPRKWSVRCRGDRYLRQFRPLPTGDSLAEAMLMARLAEAIEVVESDGQPFLLAVPTLATGALDASVLVGRVAEFERLGVDPAPVDLGQALLRATPTSDAQVLRTAEGLRSEAGGRLARWLREGGMPHQDSTPEQWPEPGQGPPPARWWQPAHPGLVPQPPLPMVAAALVGSGRGQCWDAESFAPFWVAQLPHHRDELVARYSDGPFCRVQPFIAESGGPAGFAVHMGLARCLRHARGGDRDATADALLVLAARGQLDAELLGRQLQALVRRVDGTNRLHDCLRAAAETGAYATVWSVLTAALPGLLRDTPVRGAGVLLALAVDCASRCGAKGRIPEVDEVAGRKGSSQTVKNARLLRDALR